MGIIQAIDKFFTAAVEFSAGILFFDFGTGMPLIVMWLIAGALFFTLRMGFINLRAFRHALDVVRGKFDDPREKGEVTHFQALTSALSATVGLGNIAGVTIAVTVGGAGTESSSSRRPGRPRLWCPQGRFPKRIFSLRPPEEAVVGNRAFLRQPGRSASPGIQLPGWRARFYWRP